MTGKSEKAGGYRVIVYAETPHGTRVAPVSLGQLRCQKQQNALSQVSDTFLIPLLSILQAEACKHRGRSEVLVQQHKYWSNLLPRLEQGGTVEGIAALWVITSSLEFLLE